MERNREARRGSMAAVNGVLSRRRQRSSSLRDSPEDDGRGGGVELHDGATRLRERASTSKKDRDRERSSRSSKRRRGERVVHSGGGREEGEDSSEESVDDDEEDDYEESTAAAPSSQTVRLPPPPLMPPPNPSLQNPSPPNHHNHHHRKGIATKIPRVPAVWKVADEMIGVSVPRKARTASAKRSHECWVSGSGGGGGAGAGGGGGGGVTVDAAVHLQPSTSPARPSPSSSAPISPSSSNASIRKKLKPSSGNKHRPPKILKTQSSSVQDIEFEVAEVLFGMTRQFPGPPKPEVHKSELKEAPNGSSNEAKLRVSSPNMVPALAISSQPPLLPLPNMAPLPVVVAPKRKRPRPVKLEEENPPSPLNPPVANPSISPSSKIDMEHASRIDGPGPASKLEKILVTAVENGSDQPNELGVSREALMLTDVQKEPLKMGVDVGSESKPMLMDAEATHRVDVKEETISVAVKPPSLSDVKQDEASEKKVSADAESPGKEKFQIDLMAPPPGKPSPEDEAMDDHGADYKATVSEEKDKKAETGEMEEERKDDTVKPDGGGLALESKMEARSTFEEIDSRKLPSKERMFDLHLDIPKQEKDETGNSRHPHPQKQHQQSKPTTDLKSDKSLQAGASPLPMNVAGWHGGLPPFGYMGQVPSLVSMDGNAGSAKPVQVPQVLAPPQRPKRCATHCYIAQCIQYHQQLQQLSRFWPAANATAFYSAKPQYNVNGLQPSESAVAILGNTLQGGGFPGRNIGSLQDMGSPVVAAAFGGLANKDKNPVAMNAPSDCSQIKKQLVLPQTPQGVAANSMLAPAFVFPFNQQQAAAAAAALNRPGVAKSGNGSSAPAPSTTASVGPLTAPASGTATVSFNYANLPETPYVAILQNNGYTFPIPAAHVGAPPQFRGNHPQAMPFFSNSFYTPQMLHPAQLQQQALPPQQSQQPAPSAQQGHQNKSTSSGSSSSQKHQQQRTQPGVSIAAGGATASHGLPTMKLPQHLPTGRAVETEAGSEDAPSSADSRVPAAHKGIYSHNFTMPVHPQNFALMSASDKQTHMPSSSQGSPSQAFTVSFPSLNGVTPPLGIDFSASQSHPLFQSIPEAARQGYQMAAAAAAAAASQAAQQKKTEGKSTMETVDEERKTMLSTKAPVNFSQQSLAFASSSPSLSNTATMETPGRTLNLVQPPSSGSGRSSNRPTSAAPSSTSAGATNSFNAHQQQQQSHIVQQQLQRQQQQQIIMQHQLASRSKSTTPTTSSATLYTTSAIPKFSNPLGGFPQAVVVQGGPAATNQSNQWKNATRSTAPVPIHSQSQASISSSIKSQISQQQGRTSQSSLPNQTQISFSVAAGAGGSQKMPPQSGQLLPGGNATGNPSPQSSLSKGGGGNGGGSGSPRSTTVNKQGPPLSSGLLLQQQSQQSKSSPATSSHKSSPITNRNAPSILGQPHIPPSQSSSTKQQMEQLQHFQQAQLYFSGAYMQAPTVQANAGYFQRQQQSPLQQPNSTSSAGMLSLCSPSLTLGGATATTEPGKSAVTPPSMKNMPPQNLLQAAHLAAAAGGASQRPLTSAPGFPYMHAVSAVSVKPAEQKPATGNDNLHACWQPEKR